MSNVTTVAKAVAWNIGTGVGARVVGLLGTLVLTRFIAPQEYGEVSAATICVMTAGYLVNLQFGQYIIMKGYREPGVAFHAALYHVSLGWTAIAAAFLLRDHLGSWLEAPAMGRFMGGFAISSALEVLAIVPERSLARDMRFRVIALTRGIGELLWVAVALSCVSAFGGMALVFGSMSRSLLVLSVSVLAADRTWLRPVRLSWSLTRRMVGYSSPLALANLTDFATTRWDNLLVGKFHGTEVMGVYNLAYNLAQTSTLSVAEHIADVLFPSFSRVEARHRGQALVRAASAMTIVVFPLAFGLAVVAPTVVSAFFTVKWASLAPMLAVLSVTAATTPSSWVFRAFYKAQDRTAYVMVAGILRLAVMILGIVSIGRLGPLWACAAVNLAFVVHLVFMWLGLRRDHGLLMWPAAKGVLDASLACVPLVVSVLVAQAMQRYFFPLAPVWALCLEIPAGVFGYAVGVALFARSTGKELLRLLGSMVAPLHARFWSTSARTRG